MNKLKEFKPEVVILSGGYIHITVLLTFIYCLMSNIPFIYRSDENGHTRARSSIIAKLASLLIEQHIIKKSTAMMCPGVQSKEYYIKRGADPSKIFIVPYSTADDHIFLEKSQRYKACKDVIKKDFCIKEDKVILFIGQFVERKGIGYLIQAFNSLIKESDHFALVLVGDGPLKNNYEKYCKNENIDHVYFPGYINEDKKIKFYSISDVFVLPSQKDHWGLVVNEAMLCGLPIITTNAVGASEMVLPGRNGLLVNDSNSDELYESLLQILTDNNLSSMGDCSRKFVTKNFNLMNRLQSSLDCVNFSIKKGVRHGYK
jgi:glycosyltransferase involved in cell wall biosynthesis